LHAYGRRNFSRGPLSKKDEEKECPAQEILSEGELVRRTLSGEVNAYGQLVERYQQRIFNLIGRMVGRREVVEDIAQEVFIKAYRKLGMFRGDSSFYTWLYTIALNTCRNYYRSRERSIKTVDIEESAEAMEKSQPSQRAEEILERRQKAMLVRQALDQLPADQKQVLVLCDLEGLGYQEIADFLKIPIGTVRSRIFRARMNLKELLPGDLKEN
jgi:RNA polymerase sigma-70 factor (ECF subfamily)